jgi:hypothetical protein
MIEIQPVNTTSKRDVERFVSFPYLLYKDEPLIRGDKRLVETLSSVSLGSA